MAITVSRAVTPPNRVKSGSRLPSVTDPLSLQVGGGFVGGTSVVNEVCCDGLLCWGDFDLAPACSKQHCV